VLAASVATGVLVAACTSSPGGIPVSPSAPTTTASASHPVGVSSPPGVFGRPLLWPQVAATATGLYVAWQVSRPGSAVRSELARIDAASGRVEAARYLGAAFEQAVLAAGALWVATVTGSTPAAQVLLRLNPDTLEVTGRWRVGTGGWQRGVAQVLVVAGGGLWVTGGNRLLHLSLPGGTIMASIALPGAASSDLSANAAGTVLVVGEADSGGRGAVQRRDPVTGALLASFPVMGVSAPVVAGPVGSAVWVSESSGNMGYVQRLDAATMTDEGSACREGGITSTCVEGTNDVTALLADGLLWVTQIAGGPARNYCADPVTGRAIAPVELPQPARDGVLAITPDRIFYAAPGPRADQYLRQEAIPSACRAR
jgi:DNA-binding beta-propeller fold protein YncE